MCDYDHLIYMACGQHKCDILYYLNQTTASKHSLSAELKRGMSMFNMQIYREFAKLFIREPITAFQAFVV